MQTVKLNKDGELSEILSKKNLNKPKKRFWRRQFQREATNSQKFFDWAFGVILPILCFVFDPIVFVKNGYMVEYKSFAYMLSFVSVMALAAWLIWGAKLKWLNAFLAGIFAAVSIISLIIGIAIFPISMIGLCLFFVISILGFTPLFTALVFLRSSFRAFQTTKPFLEKKILVYSFILSALFSVVVPSVINIEINKFNKSKINSEQIFID